MKNRYFKVFYVKRVGGQVNHLVCTFDELTITGNELREAGNIILDCYEWK